MVRKNAGRFGLDVKVCFLGAVVAFVLSAGFGAGEDLPAQADAAQVSVTATPTATTGVSEATTTSTASIESTSPVETPETTAVSTPTTEATEVATPEENENEGDTEQPAEEATDTPTVDATQSPEISSTPGSVDSTPTVEDTATPEPPTDTPTVEDTATPEPPTDTPTVEDTPTPEPPTPTPTLEDTPTPEAVQATPTDEPVVHAAQASASNAITAAELKKRVISTHYTWKYRDDLASVADLLYGDSDLYPLLVDANRSDLVMPDNIVRGTRLEVPRPPDDDGQLDVIRAKAEKDPYTTWLGCTVRHAQQ